MKEGCWTPFSQIDRLREELGDLESDLKEIDPVVKIKEDEDRVMIEVSLDPGELEEAEVSLSSESLLVTGKGDKVIKSITLPREVRPDGKVELRGSKLMVEAEYKN